MLIIKKLTNKKLVENFPRDPYANIVIYTKTQELHLQIAHLAIDSQYFHNIAPDAQQIRLDDPNLSEQHLIRVIRALYGGELQATSVKDLTQLYKIFEQLQIEDYKTNTIDEIIKSPQLKDDLEMLQFSFTTGILTDTFKNHHFQNKLKMMEDNKNFLNLNKISVNTMNTLLLQFQDLYGEQAHQIIINVLENYLNRNNFSPSQYFTSQTQTLKLIWEKFHHSIQYVDKIKSSDKLVKNSIILTSNSWTASKELKNNLTTSVSYDPKSLRIKQLQQTLKFKDQEIKKLQMENMRLQQLLRNQVIRIDSQPQNSQTYDFRNVKGRLIMSPTNANTKDVEQIIQDDDDQLDNYQNQSGQFESFSMDKNYTEQRKVFKTKQTRRLLNLRHHRTPIFDQYVKQ